MPCSSTAAVCLAPLRDDERVGLFASSDCSVRDERNALGGITIVCSQVELLMVVAEGKVMGKIVIVSVPSVIRVTCQLTLINENRDMLL